MTLGGWLAGRKEDRGVKWPIAVGTAVLLMVSAACTGSSSPPSETSGSSHAPVTIDYWSYWTGHEKAMVDRVEIGAFEKQVPSVTVDHVGGVTEPERLLAAVSSGKPPDLWQFWDPSNVGPYCKSGALTDLDPYIQRDNLDMSQFSPYWVKYLQDEGQQCALPQLADAYGLYYNNDLFAQAGITSPPKTMTELTTDAEKLTQFNPDGSIKVAGFIPFTNFYTQSISGFAHAFGASWLDDSGKAALASDPAWKSYFEWEKNLVDFYGYDNLQKFVAGLGNEFSASHAGEIGKVAMWMDGEWRVDFIGLDHPDLNYGTAPFPVADDHPELYGSGYVVTNILAIPKGAAHPDEAWLLAKFLSTDTNSLVYLANSVKNIPPTSAALDSPKLTSDPHFSVFLDIYKNPDSDYPPPAAVAVNAEGLTDDFNAKWVAGEVSDLQSGLAATAQQVDQQIAQGA